MQSTLELEQPPTETTKTLTSRPVNDAYFKPYEFNTNDGRRAYVDANGTFRTAFDEEADAAHPKVASSWRTQCLPAKELFARVAEMAKLNLDVTTAESNVRLTEELNLLDGTKFTPGGLRSLMLFAKIPVSMQDWLVVQEYLADLARFCNESLDKREIAWAEKPGRSPREFMVRMRKDAEGGNIVRAVLSGQYARFDNADACDVVTSAVDNLDEVLVSHGWTDADSLFLDLLLPDEMKDDPDSQWGVGFSFSNNEIGSGSFKVEPYVFRTVSRTGYRWGGFSTVIKVNQRHSGTIDHSRVRVDVKRAIDIALTEGRSMLDLLSMAQTVKLRDPSVVIAGLMHESGLTRQDVEQVARSFSKGARDPRTNGTAFGVVESVALAASQANGERRITLEGAAGRLVAPKLNSDIKALEGHWDNIETTAARKADKDTLQAVRDILGGAK